MTSTKPRELDISSEEYRIYTFAGGGTFRVDQPVKLFLIKGSAGDSHRVLDASGLTHRPSHGYVGISWKSKEGEPPFVA